MSRELLKRVYDSLGEWIPDKLRNEIKEELEKSRPEPIGQILNDQDFYSVGFDKRIGRAIWFKSLNEFHDGASLYTSPPQPKPLTPTDFWDAAPWQPMETAPDIERILVISKEIGRCVASKSTDIYGKTLWGVVNDVYVTPIAWLPLPEQK